MRLATWNVQHGAPDPDALPAACAALGVDVLALQEVDRRTERVGGRDLLDTVAAATGLTPIDGAVVDLQGGTYGNALLVRGGATDVASTLLPTAPGHEPRGALRCRLDGGLVVATVHLGFHPGEGPPQLAATLAWLDAVRGPVVLAGDLNLVGPVVPPGWRRLDVPAAYPADAPDRVIDHVLVRGAVDAYPTPDAGRPVVRDHRPVVVEIDGYELSAT
jgi:endonuclease/exonuclease/phosphatase family metal-dependent hydrolase